jgi:hypothetical protein
VKNLLGVAAVDGAIKGEQVDEGGVMVKPGHPGLVEFGVIAILKEGIALHKLWIMAAI